MIHFPEQMLLYGPLRHHWCMRFEAKNGFFKGKKWQQFVNIPLSLAKYHQTYMVHRQIGCTGELSSNYLYSGDIVREGLVINVDSTFSTDIVMKLNLAAGHAISSAYLTTSVTIHGLEYRPGCALVVNYEFDDYPVFVIVRHILVEQSNKYFIAEETEAKLDCHTLYYELKALGTTLVTSSSQLKFKWPYSVYQYNGASMVLNSCSHTCPLV
jgi:hypothetical protein